MPTLEDELFGEAPPAVSSLEDELFGAAEPTQEPDPIDHARELVAAQPLRGDQTPQQDDPWYTNAFRDIGAPAVFTENLATGALSNTADEIGAGALEGMSADTSERPEQNQGYQGIQAAPEPEREYEAGSPFEDTRNTLEQEKLARDETAPKTAIAGELVGTGLQAAALPAAAATSMPVAAGVGAGLTAANYMGQGSGDLENRASQAGQMAENNPLSSLLSVALPVGAAGAGKMFAKAAPALADASALNRTGAIMTPGQRATYAANKADGKQGLVRLGNDIVDANLHKRAPEGGWFSNLLPASTENMYDNAVALKARAGKSLGEAEQTISAVNPQVPVASISSDLRGSADDVSKMWDSAGDSESSYRRGLADRIDESTQLNPLLGHEGPASGPTGELPFSKAVEQRRYLDKQTNYTPAGGVENAGMKDQVRRQVGAQTRKNIGESLDSAATADPSLAAPVAAWRQGNKDFSLASTIEDPALMNMQKEYGGNLGLRDMATASAAQAMGIPGPLAIAAGKTMKGGRGANALAGAQKTMSNVSEKLGKGTSTIAATQAALPDPEIVREKNDSLKEQLSEAASKGWNWFNDLLGQ